MPAGTSLDWPRYEIFGLAVSAEFEFANVLPRTTAEPDITFEVVDEPVVPPELWGVPIRVEPDDWALHHWGNTEILHFVNEADFFLSPGHVACFLPNPANAHMIEIRFLGAVLAFWLERQGVVGLHASAVVIEDQALAFVSGNGGGKTSLAAQLLRRGHALLTDDLLPIELRAGRVWARRGYPQMRMWRKEAEHFLGNASRLNIVHPRYDKLRIPVGPGGIGSFSSRGSRLGAIYLLYTDEDTDRPVFEAVPPREAVLRLAEASFAAPVVAAGPKQAERLRILGETASQVPVRWLAFPPDTSRSPIIADEVLADYARYRETQNSTTGES